MVIGGRKFDFQNDFYVMGILNITPDSFSDGGLWVKPEKALKQAEKMLSEGADIIDIGGESTRPGHEAVSAQKEIERILPVIEALAAKLDIALSIDTSKADVAKAAIEAGAVFVNDVWGLKRDPKMAGLIASKGVACCLMHNREKIDYTNFFDDMLLDIQASVNLALDAGICKSKIMLDPGIGFGKTYEMNLKTLNNLEKFRTLGYPILLGTSRKSVIGMTLDLPADERVEGTVATNVIGLAKGCSMFRVHDVKETKRALKMAEAILKS